MAELYQVETGALVRAMKRNVDRFPEDFASQLTKKEFDDLRSQTGISSWGGRRYARYAFTEEGVAMLSGILRSKIAVQVNVAIMRTFVRLRRMLATNEELARKVARHDQAIGILFEHIQGLLEPPEPPKKIRSASGWRMTTSTTIDIVGTTASLECGAGYTVSAPVRLEAPFQKLFTFAERVKDTLFRERFKGNP